MAREAEYATGTIYRYFASKEDLYHRLLLRKGSAYFQEMQATLAKAKTPLDKLRALVRGKVHFFFANRDFMRIYVNEVAQPSCVTLSQPPEELRQLRDAYQQVVAGILRDGMRRGQFRKANVEMLLAALTGLTNELLVHSLAEGAEESEEEIEEFITGLFLHGAGHPPERKA